MKSRAKYRDVSDIIQRYLEPRLESECQRLGMPSSFIVGIYGTYPEPFVRSSWCELIKQDGKTQAVRIRIDGEIRSPREALMHFWHEMRHAKDYYENSWSSEWRAYLYMLKRCLEELVRPVSAWLTQRRLRP